MTFEHLKLIEPLMQAVAKEGYVTPTPIQEQAIPPLLEGKDLMGIAQTGTGKTAAFVLPILQLITQNPVQINRGAPRVLVLAPTRELAAQIDQSFSAYGRFIKFRHHAIFGGVGMAPQINALRSGLDVLVATPGRLLDLIEQRHLNLKSVEFFVLDEADRMLDMGFFRDVKRIIAMLPHKRQSLFFSATMSYEIGGLADSLLTRPVRVEVAPQATTVETVEQRMFFVDQHNKEKLLLWLLEQKHLTCVLIFTRTKRRANKLADMLSDNGINCDAIHGNKSQQQRTHALNNFKRGVTKVLVATDIAARGIDIDNISHVINYDLPNEPENYVHRIGRTARAGAAGTAYSFCSADERQYLRDIEKLTGASIELIKHEFHSDSAQNAIGAAAKPPPQHGRGNRHGGGRSRGNKPKRNDRPKWHQRRH